jgi:uncharacterized protein
MDAEDTIEGLTVTISDDRLRAYLEVAPNDGEGAPPMLQDALVRLADANVTFGIDLQLVHEAIDRPGSRVAVAQGRPAVDGVDGTIDFASDLLSVGGRPAVADDGNVDLFSLGLVHNVEPGSLLATIAAPTPGEAGMDVLGHAVRARAGRAARVLPGPGCQWSANRSQVLASIAGHATLVGDTVTMSPIYHVRGNVGPATGNIEFVGSVSISGDVVQGYHVKAGGDVEVQGSIECGEVEAGGNVSIRYGIRGHAGHGRVCAAGTVRARFIEFAEVRAHCVYATDGVVCSVVEAGADVDVLGRYGSIIGGRVVAGHSVRVGELGSTRGICTQVFVGSAPKLLGEAQELRDRLSEVTGRLQIVQERLATLQEYARDGKLNETGKLALDQCHQTYRALLDERTDLVSHQPEIIERLQAAKSASVSVRNVCHAGVRVSIGPVSHTVDQDWECVQFKRNERTGRVELTA